MMALSLWLPTSISRADIFNGSSFFFEVEDIVDFDLRKGRGVANSYHKEEKWCLSVEA